MILSARDRKRLQGVHAHLIAVVELAAARSPMAFTVLEGLRTVERQKQLVAKGASKTMNSRHLTGHAVDIAPLVDLDGDGDVEVSWHWPHFYELEPIMKAAAVELKIPLEWGGDWKFKDGPHWQLPWAEYPANSGGL